MPKTRRLLRREITYSDAKEEEFDILHQLGYYEQQVGFFEHLDLKRGWIEAVVAHHLGLPSADCHVAETEDWHHGSFNVCIPVTIDSWDGKRVLVRFPLPYRIGEAFRPGNGDEKIRCEAGTYAWLQGNCPLVPIPQLYGFALSTGETFTRLDCLPLVSRWCQRLRCRMLSWLGYPLPSNYVRNPVTSQISNDGGIDSGYILVEYIEKSRGEMLSNTWPNGQYDVKRRTNFFRSLSRIMLNITQAPLPRIGSFIIDNDGFLRLTNRPLACQIHLLENESIPLEIPRDYTYSTVDSYVADRLSLHDSRFRHQPNAINNVGDCVHQLAVLSGMRTVFPRLFQRDYRRGPFTMTLTDMHPSNILVDAEWNITCLIDLEWACSRPIEMVHPPYWLTNKGVDELHSAEYDVIRKEFMDILATEEENLGLAASAALPLPRLSDVMSRGWETGTFWYTLGLSSVSGVFTIFTKHIRPLFLSNEYAEEFNLVMPFLWERDIGSIASRKIMDKREYDKQLREVFEVPH